MCALIRKQASGPPLPGVPSAHPEALQERRFKKKTQSFVSGTIGTSARASRAKSCRSRVSSGSRLGLEPGRRCRSCKRARSDRVDAARAGWPQKLPGWAIDTGMAAAAIGPAGPRCAVPTAGHGRAVGAEPPRCRVTRRVPAHAPSGPMQNGLPVLPVKPNPATSPAGLAGSAMRAGPPGARKQATRGRQRLRPVACRWRAWARRRPATPENPAGDARSRAGRRWRRCRQRTW